MQQTPEQETVTAPAVGLYDYDYADGSTGGRLEIHDVADSGKWFFVEMLNPAFQGLIDWKPLSWFGTVELTPVTPEV